MLYIILGVCAFIGFITFDLASLHEHVVLKYVSGVVGVGILIYSTVMIVRSGDVFVFGDVLSAISYLFALVFLSLLIYSVFIEVGSNTYEVNAKPALVTDGTYSLVRHPGVIWFFLTFLFSALAFGSLLLLHAAIVWSTINLIYTYMQEKYILYRIFHNYDDYKETTPMFIPNITSFKKFFTSENWRKQ